MKELYDIATNIDIDLDIRYAAIKIMQEKQRQDPVNYLKRWNRNMRQRMYSKKRQFRELARKVSSA